MNKLVAMTIMDRPEGTLIAYTYSVLDATGNIMQQNVLDSFYVMDTDTDILADITAVKTFVNTRLNPTATVISTTQTATTSSVNTSVSGTTSANTTTTV